MSVRLGLLRHSLVVSLVVLVASIVLAAPLDQPQIVTSPASFHADLMTGQSSSQVLTVENTGTAPLNWTIPPPLTSALAEGTESKSKGGPDALGYSFIDSDEPGGPAFAWTDIATTGVELPLSGNDEITDWIPLGFEFPFYGQKMTAVKVSTNGFLTFGDDGPQYANQGLPSAWSPSYLIAPFWDDLYFAVQNRVRYVRLNDQVTFQFTDILRYSGNDRYTFQVTLYSDGRIMFRYLSMVGQLNGATIGIQDGSKTVGLQVAFNRAYVHDRLAVLVRTEAHWLHVSPMSGQLAPGERQDVAVVLDAADLGGGQYSSSIEVDSNDPVNPALLHPVTLNVSAAPDLVVSPSALPFGSTMIGRTATLVLTITNAGTALLNIDSITSDRPEFVVDTAALQLLQGESTTLNVTFTPSGRGPVAGTLTLHSDDPDQPVTNVPLSGSGANPPVIAVEPGAVSAVAPSGQTATATVRVTNAGEADLHFTVVPRISSRVVVQAPAVTGRVGFSTTSSIAGSGATTVAPGPASATYTGPDGTFEMLSGTANRLTGIAADQGQRMLYAQVLGGTDWMRYSVDTAEWITLAPAPVLAGNDAGAVLLNGRIYVTYTSSSSMLAVYDIASDTWSTTPSPLPWTGALASDGVRYLYFALGTRLVRFDPETSATEDLAAPPFAFSNWAGLAWFDGRLYGHQGGNRTGFAAYDTATGNWRRLPDVPDGAVFGAAIDPVSREYDTVGPYYGSTFYRFSLVNETWRTMTLPFAPTNDCGLGFLPGYPPGVYIVQAEGGTNFVRYVPAVLWLAATPGTGTVPAGTSQDVTIGFDSNGADVGRHDGVLEFQSDDPERPVVTVPATFQVTGVPRIAVLGAERVVESSKDYTWYGSTTHHQLPVEVDTAGVASLEVTVQGAFSGSGQLATVVAESTTLGQVGSTGVYCAAADKVFPIAEDQFRAWAADGNLFVDLANNASVDPYCTINRHTVRLRYHLSGARLDFGTVLSGTKSLGELVIQNDGDDVLEVTSIASDSPFFGPDASRMTLAPHGSQAFHVSFGPDSAATFDGVLSIVSNDAQHPVVTVPLHGIAIPPPVIAVSPAQFVESLVTNETRTEALTIANNGASDLDWSAVAVSADAVSIVDRSPDFAPSAPPAKRDAAAEVYESAVPSFGRPMQRSSSTPLERVLEQLDRRFESVTGLIPKRYDFSEGVTGDHINTGGQYMYREGNHLSTGSTTTLGYSDGVIVDDTALGNKGRYFTRKYPGLFVFAGDLDGISEFKILGYLGAGGSGIANGSVLRFEVLGRPYLAFTKRVYNAGTPSVNHCLIVPLGEGLNHEFATYTYYDDHRLVGLENTHRLYYLLYSTLDGSLVDDAATAAIAHAFINAFEPDWVTVSPASGRVAPGSSASVAVRFDATGSGTADFAGTIAVTSNDPLTPRVVVPATLHVTGSPDITVLGSLVVAESAKPFNGTSATTHHEFPIAAAPVGSGTLTVLADGDYYYADQLATVTAESTAIGTVGGGGWCAQSSGVFTLGASTLAALAADGRVAVDVQNSNWVYPDCALNRHTVRLSYRTAADRLDFGTQFVGVSRRLSLDIRNDGTDTLVLSSITTGQAAFIPEPASASVEPGQIVTVYVTFSPAAVTVFDGVLTFASNDPDEPSVTVPLHGEALAAPVLTVAPAAFTESLVTNQVVTRTLTIGNTGGSALEWSAMPRSADAGLPSLENVLAALDRHGADVTGLVPSRYDFTEGVTGTSINDGGNNMYDGGNVIRTSAVYQPVRYSDGVIVSSAQFGAQGRYVTRKIPGLFVLAADTDRLGDFYVSGYLGAYGNGRASGRVIDTVVGGARYLGFVKRVSNATTPSVNHLVIVPYSAEASQTYDASTWYDSHTVMGLAETTRLYYLLFSSRDGGYIDDSAMQSIMEQFLRSISLPWLSMAPLSGRVDAGAAVDVPVQFDATGLGTVDLSALITLSTNDPVRSSVDVPAIVHVQGTPDIRLEGEPYTATSTADYRSSGAMTSHEFETSVRPGGRGTLEIVAEGNYSYTNETATVTAEGTPLGTVGGTGTDCSPAKATYELTAERLAALTADGHVVVDVQNSSYVDAYCAINRHTVRLSYDGPVDLIDFGRVFVGDPKHMNIVIRNNGVAMLYVSPIMSDHEQFVPGFQAINLAPGAAATLGITFTPDAGQVFDGLLTVRSNDPDQPLVSLPLHGEGLIPPAVSVAPAEGFSERLLTNQVVTRTLTITNSGGSDLVATLTPRLDVASTASESPLAPQDPRDPSEEPGDEAPAPLTSASERTPTLPLIENFEDGSLANWTLVPNSTLKEVTVMTAAAGTQFSHHQLTATSGYHYSGVERVLGNIRPSYVSFWVRPGRNASTAYFVLRGPDGQDLIWFFAKDTGRLYINDNEQATYSPYGWYHIELRDVDFVTHTFSFVVDGRLVAERLAFRHPTSATGFAYLELYNYTYGSEAYWDEILFGSVNDIPPTWLDVQPRTVIVPPGASTDVTVTLDAARLDDGDYQGRIVLESNDPLRPEVQTPALLHVTGVPDLVVGGAIDLRESTIPFTYTGDGTRHRFELGSEPVTKLVVEATVEGDFALYDKYATIAAEGISLGIVRGTGTGCSTGSGRMPVSTVLLAQLAADGLIEVDVSNQATVTPNCEVSRHTVVAELYGSPDRVAFGETWLGTVGTRQLELLNTGTKYLEVSAIESDRPEFTVLQSSLTLAAGASGRVPITLSCATRGAVSGTLRLTSNDPVQPIIELPLIGTCASPPELAVDPLAISRTVLVGQSETVEIALANRGDATLSFRAFVEPGAQRTASPGGSNEVAPDGPLPLDRTPAFTHDPLATVLILRNGAPWGSTATESVLANAGYHYDIVSTSEFLDVDLAPYRVLIISSDQTTATYLDIAAMSDRIDAFVSEGGVLELHTSLGWNGGDPTLLRPPGGLTVNYGSAYYDYVVDAAHPIVAGVPSPFYGNRANLTWLSTLPPNSDVITVDESSRPTLVVYPFGRGMVIATGLVVEWAWDHGYANARMLPNMVSYANRYEPFWAQVTPAFGRVPGATSTPLSVLLDASGLPLGARDTTLRIETNDPNRPVADVPIHLSVVRMIADAGADVARECTGDGVGTVRLDGSGSRHADGHAAITTYRWYEGETMLGEGEQLEVPLSIGKHRIMLWISDAAGNTATDHVVATVADTLPPVGHVTAPSSETCYGPAALPVVVADDFTDACTGEVTRVYDPPTGPVYTAHGDHLVSVTAIDAAGNAFTPASTTFTIDTVAPAVTIYPLNNWTFPYFIQFQSIFTSSDEDGAMGGVVHETIAVDGCVVYDGNEYGNRDGRLLDESAPATEDELCRLARLCNRREWNAPVITVTATDCGGNTTTVSSTKPGHYSASRCQ